MKLFDCGCSYGVSARPAFRFARDPTELIAEMDFCGIDRALVCHAGMRLSSPVFWNQQLVAEVESFPRLEPTWAILPVQTGEQAPGDRHRSLRKSCTARWSAEATLCNGASDRGTSVVGAGSSRRTGL